MAEPPRDNRPERPADLSDAAHRAAMRRQMEQDDPEPSLGRRFAQIGVLGWMTVLPTLLGLLFGHWLDRLLGGGITLAAALTMLGAALGLWLAFRWMHQQ
ncbi:MAG: ATP synthase subunit [Limimaricola sp.]|uniref:AtpZ/AtpI family protein n=1 Tax=Limimaricola sp. TaxID=2211665 RepID=UPI001E028A3C|nr:AtpZ/AtpI family protein [Limimaricola sp.]MBI1418204.1 ATP synthase subunit [Limimaricola sp.]